jgi:hypothetical protein
MVSKIPDRRFFVALFFICSVASTSVGLYFRPHYFITLLPALALFTGLAVSRALHALKHEKTLELFVAIPILGLLLVAVLWSLAGNGAVWFTLSPDKAHLEVYRSTVFDESAKMADYIRTHAAKNARIAVVGSEPEIYFLARRRSASGYIYMFPLMEDQPYAAKMQEEMIAEIEKNRPEYVVYVNDDFSWLRGPNSNPRVLDWWKGYWAENLELVTTVPIKEWPADKDEPQPAANSGRDPKCVVLLKIKAQNR